MIDNHNQRTDEQDRRMEEARRRWDTEWGPPISPWRRRLAGIFIVVAFFGLIVGAFLTAGR
jgi:hypothetical protein